MLPVYHFGGEEFHSPVDFGERFPEHGVDVVEGDGRHDAAAQRRARALRQHVGEQLGEAVEAGVRERRQRRQHGALHVERVVPQLAAAREAARVRVHGAAVAHVVRRVGVRRPCGNMARLGLILVFVLFSAGNKGRSQKVDEEQSSCLCIKAKV